MYFVEREDLASSLDGDSFCSAYDSDDESQSIGSSPVGMRIDSPLSKRWSTGSAAPQGHRRQDSHGSTCTVDMFHGDSFQVFDDSKRPEVLTLDASQGQQRSAELGKAPLPPLSEDDMEQESPEPAYIKNTKIPIQGWFHSCRYVLFQLQPDIDSLTARQLALYAYHYYEANPAVMCTDHMSKLFPICRACGSWTGASLSASNVEVPMCKRCQQKWNRVVAGHDVPLYNQDGRSDLLKQHVRHKLKTCLPEDGNHRKPTRRDVCSEALLEVHQAWIVHNGEEL